MVWGFQPSQPNLFGSMSAVPAIGTPHRAGAARQQCGAAAGENGEAEAGQCAYLLSQPPSLHRMKTT
jgi:hypothetical protein